MQSRLIIFRLHHICAMKPLFPSTFLFFLTFFIISPAFIISYEQLPYDGLKNYLQVELPNVIGPESFGFDCYGKGPYVGVSDGRILKWQEAHLCWTEFAITSPKRNRKVCDGSTDPKMEPICGRPLGLKFNPATCDLYIADAYFGLVMVGPNGGAAKQLATSAEGIPFRFTNALDIDAKTGSVYFTDSSIFFQRRQYLLAIMDGDRTGRLMKYDPNSKSVTVLLKGLAMPNGVALSEDNSFLLVAQTSALQISRFWLQGPKTSTLEVFSQLQRFPDNIKRNDKGEFWVALHSGRGRLQKLANTNSQNDIAIPWYTGDPVAIKFDEDGKVMTLLDGHGGKTLESVSEVGEHNGALWIGSSLKPYVGIFKV